MAETDRHSAVGRAIRSIMINEVLLYVLVFGAILFVYHDAQVKRDRLADKAERANVALCALRADLKTRIASSEKFLADHPNGFAGIPAAQIQTSLDGQQRTVIALSILKCD